MSSSPDPTRTFSSIVVDGADRAPARSMLRAVGFTDEDFKKPQIAVASAPSDMTPCNVHLGELSEHARKGIAAAGGKPVYFNTITVTDGISMGTLGMRYSLVSREVIADSIETAVAAEGFDGLVAIGGCDKNMPGAMIAIARLNRPAVFVYGGTILPGFTAGDCDHQKPLDIVSVFEAVGQHAKGELTDAQLRDVEMSAIPGPGSCGGMYTANTLATAIEALGMSLPNSSAQLAIGPEKREDCVRAGAAVMAMLKKGVKPRDILTRHAFENAIMVSLALGGSTNLILHLLAIAHSAEVPLTLQDFKVIGE
ncbi:MAG: dihydroxy-acid dehydratase, partial [Verrucomicrobia bacterium]